MTKWFPAVDDAINTVTDALRDSDFVQDVVNIWEGDYMENLIEDPALADKIMEDIAFKSDDLPAWTEPFQDPDLDFDALKDDLEDKINLVGAAMEMGFAEAPKGLGILTMAAVVGGLILIGRG